MKIRKRLLSVAISFVLIASLAVPMFVVAQPIAAEIDYGRAAVYTAEEGNIARLPFMQQLTNTTAERYNPNTGAGVARTGINANFCNDSYGVPSVQVLRLIDGRRPASGTSNGYLSWAYTDNFGVSNRLYFVLNWGEPYTINAVRCDWWTDANVTVPSSEARVEWLDGTVWREVTNMRNPITGANVTNIGTLGMGNWNPVTFDPVTTTQLRLKLHRTGTITNGIGVGEWEVFGQAAITDPCPDCNELTCVCLPKIVGIGAIQGSPAVDNTLTAGSIVFEKNTATSGFTYQWYKTIVNEFIALDMAIDGATSATYTLTDDDLGWQMYVFVTGDGETVLGNAYSADVGPVAASTRAIVVYNIDGEEPTPANATLGAAIGTMPAPPRKSGFSVVGWFTAAEGGTQVTAATIVDSTPFHVYARYNAVPNVGNEHLRKNLEVFPNLYNEATGRIRPIFSNAATGVINEVVWIEVPVDTDLDGKRDLQRVIIRRPIETLPENGGLVVPVIARLSPYRANSGTGGAFQTFSGRINDGYVDQGPSPTLFSHLKFVDFRSNTTRGYANPEGRIYGPVDDMSYQALRSVVDRVVGRGPESHVATYMELLEDGMLKATSYTPQQAADYPWLPPARVPVSKQLNGNTTTVVPGAAGPWTSATFLPLGIGHVHVDIIGCDFAEGILQYGMYQESLAAAAVVDWLNGRIRGYTDHTGTVEVEAYWATGEVAMSGTSYDGTLPIVAAMTGVEGLRTIFPGGPVTNAYNYFRENGTPYAPGGYQGEDINSTTYYTFGRGWSTASPVYATPQIWDAWWDWQEFLLYERDSETGDYSPFWDERNPLSYGFDMRKDVGVIIGHGMNDGNVKFRNAYLYNEMLKYYEIEVVKGLFHQAGHSMGNTRTGAWTTTAVMTEWVEHYLYGIASTVTTRTPNYSIENNLSTGQWRSYTTWPMGEDSYKRFYPIGGRVGAMAETPQVVTQQHAFKDTLLPTLARTTLNYQTINNGLAAHIRTNGVGNQNGFLRNALIHLGQGGALPSNGQDRWRNWIVGAYNNIAAWSGSETRLMTAGSAVTSNLSLTTAIDDRLLYYFDIPEAFTISGTVAMTAEVAAHKDVGVISAMLLDRSATSVKIVAIGSVDIRNPNPDGTLSFQVPGLANIEKGGNWHANYLFQSADIVPYGTATPTAQNFNMYTWEMDITEYTFRAGNKLGLVIFGSDPLFTYRPTDATEFTVNIGPRTFLQLPVIGYVEEPDLREEFQKAVDLISHPSVVFDIGSEFTTNEEIAAEYERLIDEILIAHRVGYKADVRQWKVVNGGDGRFYMMPPADSVLDPYYIFGDYIPVSSLKIAGPDGVPLPAVYTVARGSVVNLGLELNEDALPTNIVWSVNNPALVTVDATGKVTVRTTVGTAILTARDTVTGVTQTITLRII